MTMIVYYYSLFFFLLFFLFSFFFFVLFLFLSFLLNCLLLHLCFSFPYFLLLLQIRGGFFLWSNFKNLLHTIILFSVVHFTNNIYSKSTVLNCNPHVLSFFIYKLKKKKKSIWQFINLFGNALHHKNIETNPLLKPWIYHTNDHIKHSK